MSKNKNSLSHHYPEIRPHTFLLWQIVLCYVVTWLGLVLLTLKFNLPLRKGDYFAFPTNWQLFLLVFYYVLPFVLSLFFGLLFRPFWPNFRNLWISLLVLQGIYSLGCFAWREYCLGKWEAAVHQTKIASARVVSTETGVKESSDGQIAQGKVLVTVDMAEFPEGIYELACFLRNPKAATAQEYQRIGRAHWVLTKDALPNKTVQFTFNPKNFKSLFERGPVTVNALLNRLLIVDAFSQSALDWSRWSPFLRSVSWTGEDSEIYDQALEIEIFRDMATLTIPAGKITYQPVNFNYFINEQGRDLDGDGFYDQLAVRLKVTSDINSTVAISARLRQSNAGVEQRLYLVQGANNLEFIIGAAQIQATRLNGPYDLVDFSLTWDASSCPAQLCPPAQAGANKIYFEDYRTRDYSLEQFDRN